MNRSIQLLLYYNIVYMRYYIFVSEVYKCLLAFQVELLVAFCQRFFLGQIGEATKESIAERLVHVEYESLVADPVDNSVRVSLKVD